MNVSGNDVKVLGKVVSIAVDNIVADAEQVFDKNANLNQETINRNMTNAINQAVADVSSINTRVGSLEDALDDKLNISDYQTYSTQMRESIMAKISEVEEEKQDVLTFDNTPTANSNNPVTSDGIKNAIDEIISYDSTYNRKTLESTYVQLTGHPCIYLTAGGEWPEDAGEIILHSTEGTVELIGDSYVHMRSGKQQYTTSPIVGGSIDIETGGHISINGDPVKINGTDINTIKNNAQTALNKINAMYPDEGKGMQIETPGIYYAYPGFGDPDIIPSSMGHGITTGYLLLVTTEMETDAHGGVYNYLHQLIIDIVTGRKAKRLIGYSDGTIDWSTAPNFTEV